VRTEQAETTAPCQYRVLSICRSFNVRIELSCRVLGLIPSVVQNTIADKMTVIRIRTILLPFLIVSVFCLPECLALKVRCSTTSTTSHLLTVSSPITCKSAWIDSTRLKNTYPQYIAFATLFLRMCLQFNPKLVVPCLTALKLEGSPGHVQVP